MVSIVNVSSLFRGSRVTGNCHWVQRRRRKSIQRSRSASGETSALRPWLARSNSSRQRSSECAASRSSPSRLHYRTVFSASGPTTAIVSCTRVRWWRRRLLLRRLQAFCNSPTRLLERGDVHRKALFLFTVRKRRGQVPAPNGRRRRRRRRTSATRRRRMPATTTVELRVGRRQMPATDVTVTVVVQVRLGVGEGRRPRRRRQASDGGGRCRQRRPM